MVSLRPFRALRPAPDLAAAMAAPPYDVVSADEARALASENPLTFLHVSRAEIDLPPDTDPYSDVVYARAAENFRALARHTIQEDAPVLYVYRLRMGDHEQTGVAGCFSIDEYNRDVIKKHERTRRDKEDDRTRHIIELHAQTGPVFLVYRHADGVDGAIRRAVEADPLYDFVADDGVGHTIWKADAHTTDALTRAFADLPALYIADGHHRAASAARANARFAAEVEEGEEPPGASRGSSGSQPDHAWFLAVAFPDNQTQILPYNRLVTDLNGHTPDSFLDVLRVGFNLRHGGPTPSRRGECAVFVAGAWYAIDLQPSNADAASDPVSSLDVSVLQERILGPILGVLDPRTDTRIHFVGGIRGPGELERAVAEGAAAVAFSLYPVTVAELMAIADAGGIMPPKSTWFEPKLRDGLLTHLI